MMSPFGFAIRTAHTAQLLSSGLTEPRAPECASHVNRVRLVRDPSSAYVGSRNSAHFMASLDFVVLHLDHASQRTLLYFDPEVNQAVHISLLEILDLIHGFSSNQWPFGFRDSTIVFNQNGNTGL